MRIRIGLPRFVAVSLAVMIGVSALAAEPIGQLNQITGDVQIVRGIFKTTPKTVGAKVEKGNIEVGDRIRVQKGSATLALNPEGVVLKLADDTEVRIAKWGTEKGKKPTAVVREIDVITGRMDLSTPGPLTLPIQVKAAESTTRITGTQVQFSVSERGDWVVSCSQVSDPKGVEVSETVTGAELSLDAGQQVRGGKVTDNAILLTHLSASTKDLDIALAEGTHVRPLQPGESVLLTLNADGTCTVAAVRGTADVVDRQGAPHILAEGASFTTPPVAVAGITPSAGAGGQGATAGVPAPSPYDGIYVTTAATGEKIPYPLSRKTYDVTYGKQTVKVLEAMVYVPPGDFLMGEDVAKGPEGPSHVTFLGGYYMDKYEVTNAEYMEFVKATHYRMPEHIKRNGGKIPKGRENHPVTYVSWDDAQAYCKWCGKRLPTEAEWEKAASWDEVNKKKNIYPWGNYGEGPDHPQPLANWSARWGYVPGSDVRAWMTGFDSSEKGKDLIRLGGATAAVSTYKLDESPYKCYDMGGNVLEWVQDWYDRYPGNTTPDPKYGKDLRVCRGGNWDADMTQCRTTARLARQPTDCLPGLGFRCVVDYPEIPVPGIVPQAGMETGPVPPQRIGPGGGGGGASNQL